MEKKLVRNCGKEVKFAPLIMQGVSKHMYIEGQAPVKFSRT